MIIKPQSFTAQPQAPAFNHCYVRIQFEVEGRKPSGY